MEDPRSLVQWRTAAAPCTSARLDHPEDLRAAPSKLQQTALILTRKIILTAGTEWRFYMTTHSVMSLPWPAGPSPPAPAAPLFALLPFPVAPAAAAAAASASRPSASRDADAAVLFVPTAAALPPAPPAPPAFDVVTLPTFAPAAAPAAGALDAAVARHCSATRIVAVAEWVRDGE
jgi:hypothetical protein